MASGRSLVSFAKELITEQFRSLGFKKRKTFIYTRELNKETLGWIGINDVLEQGRYYVNPVVGVCNLVIGELEAALVDRKFEPHIGPTVSRTLIDLIPGKPRARWVFADDTNNEAVAKELGTLIRKYGLPFMERFLDRTSLLEALHQPFERHHLSSRVFAVPLLMYSLGNAAEAMVVAREFATSLEKEAGQAGLKESYRKFAAALEAISGRRH